MAAKRAALLAFMRERHRIYLRRKSGAPSPWTRDPILQQFKFTNVYRELDAVSIWVHDNVIVPYAESSRLWFMLALCRQINLPDTLRDIQLADLWPVDSWRPVEVREVMLARQARGEKVYTGAYMLNAHGGRAPGDPMDKPFFTCNIVLSPLWKARELVGSAFRSGFLQTAAESLLPYHGWGSFTAAQVVADAKHTALLEDAKDWWDWAAPGPGSRKGLDVVLGNSVADTDWLYELNELRAWIHDRWEYERLCAQNLQNCLCEFYKYDRGYSRTKFKGATKA